MFMLWSLIMILKCLLMENILLILDREYYLIKDIYPIMILLSICLLFIGDNTHYILLAHLSQDNNTEELAYETLENRLKRR